MQQIELLAPAGDLSCLRAALRFGADAVYVGGPQLQLRAASAGFDENALSDAITAVHEANKRLYVTVNSFANNDEIDQLGDYARFLRDLGADALIISDLGALKAVKDAVPEIEVHISTQANCQNYMAARVYHDMGAKRIVLAREMTLEEIAQLRAKTPSDLELEAFVHGAMCMAYSGRCLISSFLTGRSGNRGGCAQPCRWEYHLMEKKRPGEFFPIMEEDGMTAILSSHDLNCIDLLTKLADAGVSSFKIEGRMKTEYYVATVVNAYRRRMDENGDPEKLRAELDCIMHRPYCTGFYEGSLPADHYNGGAYEQDCTFVAAVLGHKDGMLHVEQRNHFTVGQTLEIISPRYGNAVIPVEAIYTEEGESVQAAPHPKEKLFIPCSLALEPGDLLRRRLKSAAE